MFVIHFIIIIFFSCSHTHSFFIFIILFKQNLYLLFEFNFIILQIIIMIIDQDHFKILIFKFYIENRLCYFENRYQNLRMKILDL